MILWLDQQLSPALAGWIARRFDLVARSVRDLGFASASDAEIFFAARETQAVVITKDQDFVRLLERHGPPPRIIWVTCGNTSNARMRELLTTALSTALALLGQGESLIEISDARLP